MDEVSVDEVSVDEVSVDEVSVDEVSVWRVFRSGIRVMAELYKVVLVVEVIIIRLYFVEEDSDIAITIININT